MMKKGIAGIGLLLVICSFMLHDSSDNRKYNLPHNDLVPYRPLWMVLMNALLSAIDIIPSFSPENAMFLGSLTTGLKDYDVDYALLTGSKAANASLSKEKKPRDEQFYQGLSIFTDALNKEADLTPVGKVFSHFMIEMAMRNRLNLINVQEKVNDVQVISPVFVAGTPRSGTTFLHNLLMQDTDRFKPATNWEIGDAVPPVGPDFQNSWKSWLRLGMFKANLGFFNIFIAPKIAPVHPIDALNAEECMPILAMQMVSLHWNTLYNVSKYNDWMFDQDQRKPFLFHKLFLKNMLAPYANAGINKMALLKAPWHMNHLDVLLETYPDAKIIIPHRNPYDMITSLSSLHARLYGLLSDNIRVQDIGSYQLRTWTKLLKRYTSTRKRLGLLPGGTNPDKIFDLSFENDLKNEPIEGVKKIYKHFGWTLSAKAEKNMRDWLDNDKKLGKKGAAGRHYYEASWFGLDSTESKKHIKEAFEGYCELHKVCGDK